MRVDSPAVATQAAKALEYIAVRNDIVESAEERSEVEAETVKSLVALLHRWGREERGSVGREAGGAAPLGAAPLGAAPLAP
jgi:hypothetical protein